MEMAVIGVFLHFFFFFFFFFFFKSVCLIVLMVLVVYADDHQWWSWQFRTCVHNDHDSSESMFRKINNFIYWPNKAFTSSSVATHIVTCGCHYTCQCVCVCVHVCVCVCEHACTCACITELERWREQGHRKQSSQCSSPEWAPHCHLFLTMQPLAPAALCICYYTPVSRVLQTNMHQSVCMSLTGIGDCASYLVLHILITFSDLVWKYSREREIHVRTRTQTHWKM